MGMIFKVTKSYRDFPAAHRQPNHDGHCRLIHGHNWGWDITLSCAKLDGNGFVLDVGKLQSVKAFLVEHFDHTLLINEADPIRRSEDMGVLAELAKVVIVPNCGMEGLAKFVFDVMENILLTEFVDDVAHRGLRVLSVVCFEDSKNYATYQRR